MLYWTNDRKHTLSCQRLVFQISLEPDYIISSFTENPFYPLEWNTSSQTFAFYIKLPKFIRKLKFFAYDFCQIDTTHFAQIGKIFIEHLFIMTLILAHH